MNAADELWKEIGREDQNVPEVEFLNAYCGSESTVRVLFNSTVNCESSLAVFTDGWLIPQPFSAFGWKSRFSPERIPAFLVC